MKMNCVFFSDGVQREMVREVGGGGVERGRGIYKCATNVLEMKITMGFELVQKSPKAMSEGLSGVNR